MSLKTELENSDSETGHAHKDQYACWHFFANFKCYQITGVDKSLKFSKVLVLYSK